MKLSSLLWQYDKKEIKNEPHLKITNWSFYVSLPICGSYEFVCGQLLRLFEFTEGAGWADACPPAMKHARLSEDTTHLKPSLLSLELGLGTRTTSLFPGPQEAVCTVTVGCAEGLLSAECESVCWSFSTPCHTGYNVNSGTSGTNSSRQTVWLPAPYRLVRTIPRPRSDGGDEISLFHGVVQSDLADSVVPASEC